MSGGAEDGRESPLEDTMWTRCLFLQLDRDREAGKERLQFADVDALVVELSQLPVAGMLSTLGFEGGPHGKD